MRHSMLHTIDSATDGCIFECICTAMLTNTRRTLWISNFTLV